MVRNQVKDMVWNQRSQVKDMVLPKVSMEPIERHGLESAEKKYETK